LQVYLENLKSAKIEATVQQLSKFVISGGGTDHVGNGRGTSQKLTDDEIDNYSEREKEVKSYCCHQLLPEKAAIEEAEKLLIIIVLH
jgi:uncharacterized protein YktB (UPF0637 family)